MTKVTGACFSLSASGNLGGVIEYSCGERAAVSKRSDPGRDNLPFNEQQDKFKAGTGVWNTLSEEEKEDWRLTSWWVGGEKGPHAQPFLVEGYQAFMSYYLRYGPNGWPDYPAAGPVR